MRFRKLRIAWSVVCGVLAVLLIVLWVRSYGGEDFASWAPSPTRVFRASSLTGRLNFETYSPAGLAGSAINFRPMDDGERKYSELMRQKENWLGFVLIHSTATDWHVIIPHWLFVIVTVGLAVAPWLSRRWRFSLRTLLIATTLVAVVLGLIVWLR